MNDINKQKTKSFIFLGGDLRFIHTAAKLACTDERFKCYVYGFEDLCDKDRKSIENIQNIEFTTEIKRCDNVVLPLPASRDGKYINAPHSSKEIPISYISKVARDNAVVYCGKACDSVISLCRNNHFSLIDYFDREELTVLNAAITAEGTLGIIMNENKKAIMGMNVLITGYGRIARILSKYLHYLGANVIVCARRFSDLAWARTMGCNAVHLNEMDTVLGNLDTVVNTVPAVIFDRAAISGLKRDCFIVDIASKKGVETDACEELGIKTIWALSIPGRVAPITAGEIIADTITNIMSEKEEL